MQEKENMQEKMKKMDNSIGNSDKITRAYIDSLMIETRYMDTVDPCLDFELYGEKFSSPIMTAALQKKDDARKMD